MLEARNGDSLLVSPGLARLDTVVHGFTTRAAGSASVAGSSPDAVTRALRESRPDEGDEWRRCALTQVHGARVVRADGSGEDAGDGGAPEADAVVSSKPGRLLVVRTADCVPVLLARVGEPGRVDAVGAAHAGWRGLLAGVLQACVRELAEDGARVIAAIGPAIGPCCFEVGEDVAGPLAEAHGADVVRVRPGRRPHGDLPLASTRALVAAGAEVPDGHEPPCTRCDPERFHSYRADGERAGRMGAFIGRRDPERR